MLFDNQALNISSHNKLFHNSQEYQWGSIGIVYPVQLHYETFTVCGRWVPHIKQWHNFDFTHMTILDGTQLSVFLKTTLLKTWVCFILSDKYASATTMHQSEV